VPRKPCRFCRELNAHFEEMRVFSSDKDGLLIGGSRPKPELLSQLAADAKFISNTVLWEILTQTAKSSAVKIGINDARDFDATLLAKAVLYYIQSNERIIEFFKNLKV
jgi:hypothetical protein